MEFDVAGDRYRIDASTPIDISIPLRFNGPQPAAFHIAAATSQPIEAGTFVGDTRRGGSCNCETVTLNPHGNGTHTECVGHLSNARLAIGEALREPFVPAALVTAMPMRAGAGDTAVDLARLGDTVITRRELVRAVESLGSVPPAFFRALVVRTTPNDPGKLCATYSGADPAYLTTAAMRLVRELGVQHLLLDLPSVDPEEDGGALAAHRIFWDLAPEGHDIPELYAPRTITEMIYVSDAVPDGLYMVNIQIPHFMLDAAPSRPLLFPVAAA